MADAHEVVAAFSKRRILMLKVAYWRQSKPNEEREIFVDNEMPYNPSSLRFLVALVCDQEGIPEGEFMLLTMVESVASAEIIP